MLLKELKIIHELDDTPFQRGIDSLKYHLGAGGSGSGRAPTKENVDPSMVSLFLKIAETAAIDTQVQASDVKRLIPAGKSSDDAEEALENSLNLLGDTRDQFVSGLGSISNSGNLGVTKGGMADWIRKQDSDVEDTIKGEAGKDKNKVLASIKSHKAALVKLMMRTQSGHDLNQLALKAIDKDLEIEPGGHPTTSQTAAATKKVVEHLALIKILEVSIQNTINLIKKQPAPDASA
jgi:hypothetical protein